MWCIAPHTFFSCDAFCAVHHTFRRPCLRIINNKFHAHRQTSDQNCVHWILSIMLNEFVPRKRNSISKAGCFFFDICLEERKYK